jgi:glycosyltransferase involved in cell wall biosynthesis
VRILIVCGAGYVAGKEVVTLALLRGLRDLGHETLCATSTWADGDFEGRLLKSGLRSSKIHVGFISRRMTASAVRMTTEQLRRLPGLWREYQGLLADFTPDVIVHTNHHHLALLSGRAGTIPQIFHMHDGVAQTLFHRILFRVLCSRVDRVIAVSRHIREAMISAGVSASKITVVPNGLEPPPRRADRPDDSSQDEPVIGMASQIAPWKGHETLLDALALLKRGRTSFRCVIFGKGDTGYTERLKRRADELGLADRIEWKGFVTDQNEIYAGMDICVVPTLTDEPFGLAALEPALRGIPVVASRRGGLPEVVVHEQTGLLFEAAKADELAASLRRLLFQPDLRRMLGSHAQQRTRDYFTADRMARSFAEVLYDVTGAATARKPGGRIR